MKQFEAGIAALKRLADAGRALRGGRGSQAAVLLLVLLLLYALTGTALYRTMRERAFDTALERHEPLSPAALIVDIDRPSLQSLGAWPWSRERLAALVTRLADAEARVIAVDLVLEGDDTRSPAALARALLARQPLPGLAAAELPDGDKLLGDAVAARPTVLGLALDPQPRERPPGVRPILLQGPPDVAQVWTEGGLVGAPALVAARAAGAGITVMPGDHDGNVRRVPLFVVADEVLVPGLSAEALRVARGQPMMRLQNRPPVLMVGAARIALDEEAMIRIAPPRQAALDATTISAAQILAGDTAALRRIAGAVVIIGSSAPEAGGLRPNGAGELMPSSAFHAAALQSLIRGAIPRRPRSIETLETLGFGLAGLAGGVAGATLTPWLALAVIGGAAAACVGLIVLALGSSMLLIDPLLVPLAALGGVLSTILIGAARTRRLQTQMRQRFEQHLSPAVIAQLVENPSALRIEGRERVITALFTDVEGFTAMTERAAARDLIAVLDRYFDGMCRIVVAHGGMIDKIVGDAVHAIFNAPLDLDEHPRRAIDCARELARFADAYRQEVLPLALGFGRTRIGIETGVAIVGDVGGERKLDYTAHGHAVNAAARLEAVNKELGTTIAIGPGTAAAVGVASLRKAGTVTLRGQDGAQDVYTVEA